MQYLRKLIDTVTLDSEIFKIYEIYYKIECVVQSPLYNNVT